MATRISQQQLNKFISPEAAMAPYERAQQDKIARNAQDAALKQLITGKQMDDVAKNAMYEKQLGTAQDLRAKYGSEANIDAGEVKIGGIDPLTHLLKARELQKPSLTPAQTASETASGKKLADYEAGGGRATSAKNIEQVQSVQDDLTPDAKGNTKRDWYDRKVGGLLNGISPTLMGSFAPAEKARRDKAYNAAMMLARQSDPNPTENQIRNIMGQIYDPSSDDATNLERVKRFQQQQRGVDADMSRAASNLQSTGYVMPGLSGNTPAPSQPRVQPAPLRGMPSPVPQPQQGGTGLEHLSDAELAAMAKKLGL